MATYMLDDIRSLQRKIDAKALDLFKAKDGQAPLQVTRIFDDKVVNCVEKRPRKKQKPTSFIRGQNVWNSSQLKALRHVRKPLKVLSVGTGGREHSFPSLS